MKEVPLTKGKVALVDDEDFERVIAFTWQATQSSSGAWYARRGVWQRDSKRQKALYLHQFILSLTAGQEVDHRNRNGLDCQRGNLRPATHAQNGCNAGLRKDNTTGFKGVRKSGNRWYPQICINGKQTTGRGGAGYATAEDAARARDELAKEHFGEFAWLNFTSEP